MDDEQIMCALIGQVSKAAAGGSEREVTTIITRPMWRAFLRATKSPEDAEPTNWNWPAPTHRVYGSRTIVIEREELASISFK